MRIKIFNIMAKKVKNDNSNNEEILIDAKDRFDRIKNFFNENKKVTTAIGSLLLIVILFLAQDNYGLFHLMKSHEK